MASELTPWVMETPLVLPLMGQYWVLRTVRDLVLEAEATRLRRISEAQGWVVKTGLGERIELRP